MRKSPIKKGGTMFFLVLISIMVMWFFINRLIQQRFKTSRRGWTWFRYENNLFGIIFYTLFVAYIAFPFIYPNANLFKVMPFAIASFNVLFSIEQFIYKEDEKLYIHYFLDASVWCILGVITYFFFS